MKEKLWNEYPRKTDKVAIVGFAEATRALAPFDDPSYEVWALNEEYTYPWLKRFDRWFQMHPRWDFARDNNLSHPNHLLWLMDKKDDCLFCKGAGEVKKQVKDKTEVMACPYCKEGIYTPAKTRKGVPIYMQRYWEDIPNSIAYPLNEANEFVRGGIPKHPFKPESKYFVSTPAYMLTLAMMMGFKVIELYGFDMGTETEYHYQRANFEYLIGVAHGKGIGVYLHPASRILTGELYGYINNQIGFRQNLEMRKAELERQLQIANYNIHMGRGFQKGLERVHEKYPDLDLTELYEYLEGKKEEYSGGLNVVNGALHECKEVTKLFDNYMRGGNKEGDVDAEKEQS